MPPTVLSIGHSNHPLDRFLDLLARHGVEALADILRFPGSRKHPHFHRDSLAAALQKSGVEYHWLEALGGRRHKQRDESPNLGLENKGFRNYADYMLTDEFREGWSCCWRSPGGSGRRSCALRACSGSATGGWSATPWWRTAWSSSTSCRTASYERIR